MILERINTKRRNKNKVYEIKGIQKIEERTINYARERKIARKNKKQRFVQCFIIIKK